MNIFCSSPTVRRFAVLFGVSFLLALQWWLAVGSKFEASTTSDEIVHLTSGLSYWQLHDYRLQPENGNLPQRWAAIPSWLAGAKLPDLNNESWRTSNAWVFGYSFFYTTPNQDHFPLLMAGRAMIALFLIGTSVIVFFWARSLWGMGGAWVALVFSAFCPTLLAHGALVTSDICMTFFFLAAVGAYWRHLHSDRMLWWVISPLVFGLACLAKFSAVLLLPMMLIMAVVRSLAATPMSFVGHPVASPVGRLGALALSLLGHGIVAVIIIWGFFGFRYTAFNPSLPPADHFIRPWEWITPNIGLQGRIVQSIAATRLLPEAFLYGYAYVIESAQMRGAFLDGAYSVTGWTSFFPKAFLYKTPPGLIMALLAGLMLAGLHVHQTGFQQLKRALYRSTPLLVLFGIYWAFSLTSRLNIGHRHILPTYPILFIFAGILGWATIRAWKQARSSGLILASICLGLLVWQTASTAKIHPYYLSYFSPLVGGPTEGYRHLVDSSLDWGQDLPGLQRWLAQHAAGQNVYLSYFGTSEPAYYGINAIRLPFINAFKIKTPWHRLSPGVYCIGATMLSHVYSPLRGAWTSELESEYQMLRSLEPSFLQYAQSPEQHAGLDTAAWEQAWDRYEKLRFARLCHYLRARQPDDHIGYSMLLYRLSQPELNVALQGPASALFGTAQRDQPTGAKPGHP